VSDAATTMTAMATAQPLRPEGAWLRRPRPDNPHIEIVLLGKALLDRCQRRLGRLPPIANTLARRIIDDDDGDIPPRRALLLDQGRVDERGQQHNDCDGPPAKPRGSPQDPETEA
jgi:hypothetical protein